MTDPTAIEIRVDPLTQRMQGTTNHGGLDFDVPFISHIVGNLWMGGVRDGLVLPTQIRHVVSLAPWWSYSYHDGVRSLLQIYMHDSEEQTFEQVDGIARWVYACMDDGPTLVHCQAGLNRSALISARALMLGGCVAEPAEAIALLRERRDPAVLCNPSFESWLRG